MHEKEILVEVSPDDQASHVPAGDAQVTTVSDAAAVSEPAGDHDDAADKHDTDQPADTDDQQAETPQAQATAVATSNLIDLY